MRRQLVCRVCGLEFTAARFDAKTCTDTCRSRLRRGGDLAYLDDPALSRKEKRAGRAMHAAYDDTKAAHRKLVEATRAARDERRKLREQKKEQERQRFLDEVTGRIYRQQQEDRQRQGQLSTVAGCIKLFAKERRNDFSAEAIAALLDSPHYPVEDVAERLAELKTSGDFDRIIADTQDPTTAA
jgi:hypothetical protein